MNEIPHFDAEGPLRIAFIGKDASEYVDKFPGADCRIIERHDQILDADDLVFCVSYPQLIPAQMLGRPRYGVWVNHSSDLPSGRGWAPLQWSVLKGLSEITVTIFKAVAKCDAGPWAYKLSFPIETTDTIADLRRKDVVASIEGFRRLIQAIVANQLVLHDQDGTVSFWPRRTPADSRLDASQPLAKLWDHIRICDNIDHPAFFMVDGRKVILRYEIQD